MNKNKGRKCVIVFIGTMVELLSERKKNELATNEIFCVSRVGSSARKEKTIVRSFLGEIGDCKRMHGK